MYTYIKIHICTYIGSAIGLLLVFRTNSAYGRLGEATKAWGSITKIVRDIASKAATSEDGENDKSLSPATTGFPRFL